MPPMACAPRLWHERTSSSVYARMNGTVIVTCDPVGQHELGSVAELLDHGEDVVPAAGVQPGRVLAQLVQDLLHLERGQDRLDENGGLDRPPRDAEPVLREAEHVVPQPRFEMALELREIEVRPGSALEQALDVPLEVDAEVEEARETRACRRSRRSAP